MQCDWSNEPKDHVGPETVAMFAPPGPAVCAEGTRGVREWSLMMITNQQPSKVQSSGLWMTTLFTRQHFKKVLRSLNTRLQSIQAFHHLQYISLERGKSLSLNVGGRTYGRM